jgi:hypothetical protein
LVNLARSLQLGLRRRWLFAGGRALAAVGAIWTVCEPLAAVFPSFARLLQAQASVFVTILVLSAAAAFLSAINERSRVKFRLPNTNTVLAVEFGDLFEEDGDLLVAVNESFDSKLGQIVSPSSVHGGFITKFYNADSDRFADEAAQQLGGFAYEDVAREWGPSRKYPIGTTIVLRQGNRNAYLFAFTVTDSATAKASATVPILWNSLSTALREVHNRGNGRDLALPLIGNGRSGLDIAPQHLLRLLVLIIVQTSKIYPLPANVKIVAPLACFEALDLREIRRDWK